MRPPYLIPILIAVVLFGAGFAYTIAPSAEVPNSKNQVLSNTQNQETIEKETSTPAQTETIPSQQTLESVSSPKDIRSVYTDISVYTVPVLSNTTVIAAMEAYAEVNLNFSFSGSEFPGLGLFVEEMGGLRNGGGFYWTLFINNELSEKGASQMEVSPSDTVEWRYQKGI